MARYRRVGGVYASVKTLCLFEFPEKIRITHFLYLGFIEFFNFIQSCRFPLVFHRIPVEIFVVFVFRRLCCIYRFYRSPYEFCFSCMWWYVVMVVCVCVLSFLYCVVHARLVRNFYLVFCSLSHSYIRGTFSYSPLSRIYSTRPYSSIFSLTLVIFSPSCSFSSVSFVGMRFFNIVCSRGARFKFYHILCLSDVSCASAMFVFSHKRIYIHVTVSHLLSCY